MLYSKNNSFILRVFVLTICIFSPPFFCHSESSLFWWQPYHGANFGDDLSRVIVERILGRPVNLGSLDSDKKMLFGAGSILHFARNNDLIWGSGYRGNPRSEHQFNQLDVRAVRGPKTREFLLEMGINCPKIYGDPAILMPYLFPEFKKEEPIYDYIIIPNIGEIECFIPYKNVVLPTLPWDEIVSKIMCSRLVISSSLHGIIVAEAFNIPTRFLKMTWTESLLKYQDYYESTGRTKFTYATSVQKALEMGGETPGYIDIHPLLESFPWDYFSN